jgi:hypothetical protein
MRTQLGVKYPYTLGEMVREVSALKSFRGFSRPFLVKLVLGFAGAVIVDYFEIYGGRFPTYQGGFYTQKNGFMQPKTRTYYKLEYFENGFNTVLESALPRDELWRIIRHHFGWNCFLVIADPDFKEGGQLHRAFVAAVFAWCEAKYLHEILRKLIWREFLKCPKPNAYRTPRELQEAYEILYLNK